MRLNGASRAGPSTVPVKNSLPAQDRSRCRKIGGKDASPKSFSSKGVSAHSRTKGGDHLQVCITGVPMARLDPTSRAVAGSQPLDKRG